MPRFTRKQTLKSSIQAERHARKALAQNRRGILASLDFDLGAVQFLFRVIQTLHIFRIAISNEDRQRAAGIFVIGILEFITVIKKTHQLILIGARQQAKAITEIALLDEALKIVNQNRYVVDRISRGRSELRNAWFHQMISEGGDGFIKLARMSKSSFDKLVNLIQHNPVFHNNSHVNQAPVWWQALVGLANLGTSGNGGDHFHLARLFNCSEGSIQNWTKRFVLAVLDLERNYVRWPSRADRRNLKKEAASRGFFKDCVGFIDGTLIPLSNAPREHPEDYWTRKCFYAYNAMLVCDLNRRITYYELGWCGSVHDQRVFRSSQLFQNPTKFFSPGEYLLADSGYTVSDIIIPCLKRVRGENLGAFEDAFNKAISNIRVIIEHCNGMLKGRFQSLKELRIVIKDAASALRANQWIQACIILHNFLIDNFETWSGALGRIDEGLVNETRVRQEPPNAPHFEEEGYLLSADRNDERRKELFEAFVTSLQA